MKAIFHGGLVEPIQKQKYDAIIGAHILSINLTDFQSRFYYIII